MIGLVLLIVASVVVLAWLAWWSRRPWDKPSVPPGYDPKPMTPLWPGPPAMASLADYGHEEPPGVLVVRIDLGGRALTDEHVLELVRLKRGASTAVYFVLAKLIDAVEQAVADSKADRCPKCGRPPGEIGLPIAWKWVE